MFPHPRMVWRRIIRLNNTNVRVAKIGDKSTKFGKPKYAVQPLPFPKLRAIRSRLSQDAV